MQSTRRISILIVAPVILFFTWGICGSSALVDPDARGQEAKRKTVDPAAWGSNHVGKPLPEYVRGDECLFCHRNDIGTTWQRNAHGVTLRQRENAPELTKLLEGQPPLKSVAGEVQFFLGSRHQVRFLKKEGYGKLSLLGVRAALKPDRQVEKLAGADKLIWQKDLFANRCAGCHATAVDPATKAFTLIGLDCSTCHGDVALEHSNDTSLIWRSEKTQKRCEGDHVDLRAMPCEGRLIKVDGLALRE